jgi:hypothetical protein
MAKFDLTDAERDLYALALLQPLPLAFASVAGATVRKLMALGLLERTPLGFAGIPTDAADLPAPPEPLVQCNVRLPESLGAWLREAAAGSSRTVTAVVIDALRAAQGKAEAPAATATPAEHAASGTRSRVRASEAPPAPAKRVGRSR